MFHNRFTASGLVIISGAIVNALVIPVAFSGEPVLVPAVSNSDVRAVATPTSVVAQTTSAALLSTAVIAGSTAYTPADLFPTYGSQLGRPITRESGEAIVAALVELYERDGYSRPELRVDDKLSTRGILRVNVFEPRMTAVTISGDAGPYQSRLESLAGPLNGAQPVKRAQVQQVLQNMRELPGMTVTAATKRDSTRPNAYKLEVLADYRPLEGSLRLTNRGTSEVGPNFLMSQFVANGLLKQDEKLGMLLAAAQDPKEYRGVGLFADTPLGASRTRGFLMAFRSWSDPNEEPQDRDDDYSRERILMRATRQLDNRGPVTISIGGTFEAENLGIDRSGAKLREDRLRSFEVGGKLSWRSGARTQYLTTLDVRQGFDGLGAELYAPDLLADTRVLDYTVMRAQLVRFMQLTSNWSVRLDLLGQYTGDVLPYSERFKIGGERIGRGFEVTEVAGDRGAGGKVELRRELTPSSTRFVGRTSVYSFYDFGAVWSSDGPSTRQSATSGGVGFALNGERFGGSFELAKPFTRPDLEGRNSSTLFAELSYRL